MSTIQKIKAQFNPQVIVTNQGGDISVDGGLLLIKEFFHNIRLTDRVKHFIPFTQKRSNADHSNESLFESALFQYFGGYFQDISQNVLRHDPALKILLEKDTLPSQPTFSRFWNSLDDRVLQGMTHLIDFFNETARTKRQQTEWIIDLDSTHLDTFGDQEMTDYNAHYQTTGYHPLVAFDGISGDFLKATLRPGNDYTSTDAVAFLLPLFEQFKTSPTLTQCLLRGDSGFATPKIYNQCDVDNVDFIIRLKANARLKRFAEQALPNVESEDYTHSRTVYFDFDYQAGTWDRPQRVCVQAIRPADELFYRYTFITSSLIKVPVQSVIKAYQRRGTMENYIKEAKYGFMMGKTDHSTFQANQARLVMSQLAYTLIQCFKTGCLPKASVKCQMTTLRHQVFKVGVRIVRHARQVFYHLSTSHVYYKEFFAIYERVQHFRL